MPNRHRPTWLAAFTLAMLLLPRPSLAQTIELVESDERGATLRLLVPAYELKPAETDGRFDVAVPGMRLLDQPGRPRLPYASALLAVPAGVRVSGRIIEQSGDEERVGVAIGIGERPTFEKDDVLGWVPTSTPEDPVADGGEWPTSIVTVGAPFVIRGQRMVAVNLQPFRYDERAKALRLVRQVTVRVEFSGTAASTTPAMEDRHWEPVLQGALLNYQQGRAWRIGREPARASMGGSLFESRGALNRAAGGFEENHPEVRVRIDTTGVYSLPYDLLAARGYPAGTPIGQVSVHRHEFIENTTPPYVTAELPIEVDDENVNGVFDSGDRIVVWVQNWAERSRAGIAQRHWGDAEVIYATRVDGAGLRVTTRAGWRDVVGLTPLPSYPTTRRYERNFAYVAIPPDTTTDQFYWTGGTTFYYDRPDSFPVEVSQIDASRSARIEMTWLGGSSGSHFEWVRVRNAFGQYTMAVDSFAWGGIDPRTAGGDVPGASLSEGAGNALAFWGKQSASPPDPTNNYFDFVRLDHYDVSYWRRFRALAGYLPCNNGDAVGEYQVRATGFASNRIHAYDVSDSANPVRLTLDPAHIQPGASSTFELEFQDLAGGTQHRFVVFDSPKVPSDDQFTAVTRRQLTNRATGDYALIVPEPFEAAVQPLATMRQAQGLSVATIPLQSLFDEFNGGRRSSHAIKRFVGYALNNWNTRFVVLVGNGSEDPLNHLGNSGVDWVPIHMIQGPVGSGSGYEIVPSDPWYGCFEGPETSCDALFQSNGLPVIPEVFVGRLPVVDVASTNEVVSKLVTYENFAADQTWRNKLLLSSDDEYSDATTFGGGPTTPDYCRRSYEVRFKQLNETIMSVVRDESGLLATVLDTFPLAYYLRDEPTTCCNPDLCRPSRDATRGRTQANVTPQLVAHLNEGRMWWNYQGHANNELLAHEDLYRVANFDNDNDDLTNVGKPFLFSAFACHINAFSRFSENAPARMPSVGEELLTLPGNRGAIAVWASVGYEIVPRNGVDHINVTWARSMFSDPPRDEYLGDRGARVVLGETIGLALLRHLTPVLPQPRPDFSERGIGLTYNLLGDPATRLSIGAPQALVTANDLPIITGQPIRLHTPGDTLRLEGDLVSNVRLDAISLERIDGSGTAVVPPGDYILTPSFPDSGAASNGGRRFHVLYRTNLEPDNYRYVFRTTDRYGVPGSVEATFQFLTVLRAAGIAIPDDEPVAPSVDLTMLVLSPKPLVPANDLTLTINGVLQAFTAQQAPGDASGREWILSWTHDPYPTGGYEAVLTAQGGAIRRHRFQVLVSGTELRIENALAFPNPFDDDLGTYFSFRVISGSDADVQIRVFTTNGKLIHEWEGRGLSPGYHQIPWNGYDPELSKIANGVYVYRIVASNGSDNTAYEGRLVKLRKPRRGADSP